MCPYLLFKSYYGGLWYSVVMAVDVCSRLMSFIPLMLRCLLRDFIYLIFALKLILQPYRYFTCVTTHSPTLPSRYLHHSSFSNPSVASPTSQFILQPFFRFSYVTSSSLNSPGELPMTKAVLISTVTSYGRAF